MKITFLLILACFIVFVMQAIIPGFTGTFALTPALAFDGAWWQFLTYMFLHGDPSHILINMFVFFIFGPLVERELGPRNYTALFFLSGLGSAFLYLALAGDPFVRMLGASGAIFGVMAAYAFLFPRNWIMVYFIPMPAVVAIIAITAFELLAGIFDLLPGIANFGHLGGLVTGVLFMLTWKFLSKKPRLGEEPAVKNVEFFWE